MTIVREHKPLPMTVENTRIGVVTYTGKLYCVWCARAIIVRRNSGLLDSDPCPNPIYANKAPHNTEPCNGCGKPLIKGWFDDYIDDLTLKVMNGMVSESWARQVYEEIDQAVTAILNGK